MFLKFEINHNSVFKIFMVVQAGGSFIHFWKFIIMQLFVYYYSTHVTSLVQIAQGDKNFWILNFM